MASEVLDQLRGAMIREGYKFALVRPQLLITTSIISHFSHSYPVPFFASIFQKSAHNQSILL